jgi:hypothetical protein
MIPTFVFALWLLGLISLGVLAAVIYLGREWYLQCWMWDPETRRSYFHFDPGWNEATALLAGAVGLLAPARSAC